ncbi:hypothetical protein QBC44DRAFT_326622 [Cladorrhinum sp. PSN332]|nr:hypothetical protein QBC44DRAFT_326622 [Cladorrhinum sp. PSN332]
MPPPSPELYQTITALKSLYCRLTDSNSLPQLQTAILSPDSFTAHFIDSDTRLPISDFNRTWSFSSASDFTSFYSSLLGSGSVQTLHLISGAPELEQTSPDEIKAIFTLSYSIADKSAQDGGWIGHGGGRYFETWKRDQEKEGKWRLETLRFERGFWKIMGKME